ncbi:MAG: 16S rRNA (guanine(527)-N(7))-methyltransferase RsmG, partial [Clostridia bacterium]|nr:16S rRNA (guanine(527)-N(7))-methyltransferase RsmG [Clostridia bacterium]
QFELQSAKKAIATLGGRGAKCEDITLKSDAEVLTHPLIIIDKGTKTPAAYPRPYAKISKQPL